MATFLRYALGDDSMGLLTVQLTADDCLSHFENAKKYGADWEYICKQIENDIEEIEDYELSSTSSFDLGDYACARCIVAMFNTLLVRFRQEANKKESADRKQLIFLARKVFRLSEIFNVKIARCTVSFRNGSYDCAVLEPTTYANKYAPSILRGASNFIEAHQHIVFRVSDGDDWAAKTELHSLDYPGYISVKLQEIIKEFLDMPEVDPYEIDVKLEKEIQRVNEELQPKKKEPLAQPAIPGKVLAQNSAPQSGTSPYPTPVNYARDKWIYENISNYSYQTLSLKLKKKAKTEKWTIITSRNGFKNAADRYSEYHQLPERRFESA